MQVLHQLAIKHSHNKSKQKNPKDPIKADNAIITKGKGGQRRRKLKRLP